jgi:hypothetical protein
MLNHFPETLVNGYDRRQSAPEEQLEVCRARLDYFASRITYCVLDHTHIAEGRLHASSSGIKWCCNAKDDVHREDCVRLVPIPSVVK